MYLELGTIGIARVCCPDRLLLLLRIPRRRHGLIGESRASSAERQAEVTHELPYLPYLARALRGANQRISMEQGMSEIWRETIWKGKRRKGRRDLLRAPWWLAN